MTPSDAFGTFLAWSYVSALVELAVIALLVACFGRPE